MIQLQQTLQLLAGNKVEFVIIGGVAITLHGSAYLTADLDLCYHRTKDNLRLLAAALAPYRPALRGLPGDLPFVWDESTLRQGTNFTLTTDLGDIDLLGEVADIGGYEDVRAVSVVMPLYGFDMYVLSIEALITAKRAAGRAKDLLVIPELEALREVLKRNED